MEQGRWGEGKEELTRNLDRVSLSGVMSHGSTCRYLGGGRGNRWTASFSLAGFSIPAPARGRWVLSALPLPGSSAPTNPPTLVTTTNHQAPTAWSSGQEMWTLVSRSPAVSAPSGGLAGNAEAQALTPDGLSHNLHVSVSPGDVCKREVCWARNSWSEPPGWSAKLHTSRPHLPLAQFRIQGLQCGRKAYVSLRYR